METMASFELGIAYVMLAAADRGVVATDGRLAVIGAGLPRVAQGCGRRHRGRGVSRRAWRDTNRSFHETRQVRFDSRHPTMLRANPPRHAKDRHAPHQTLRDRGRPNADRGEFRLCPGGPYTGGGKPAYIAEKPAPTAEERRGPHQT
jgi:hypothetical protein